MDKDKFFKYCYGCEPSGFAGAAVLTPFISSRRFEGYCEEVSGFRGKAYSGFTAVRNGRKVTVIHCGLGDRLMGDATLLLERTPVKKLVFTGACGGLKDCRLGDLVLAESAFSGEGFSHYHSKMFDMEEIFKKGEFFPADGKLIDGLAGFLAGHPGNNAVLKRGDVFTIGSLMAEDAETVRKIEQKGFVGLDMELSAVYCASAKAGIVAAGFLFVTDLPLKKPIEALGAEEKSAREKTIEEVVMVSLDFAAGTG